MTKREIEKCENLMHEAIRYAKESKEELEKAITQQRGSTLWLCTWN